MTDSNAALQRLDSGSIADMFVDAPNRIQNPIVQCAQIRPMQSKDGQTDRYRVVFNDGTNYIQSMLATTVNEEITSERLRRGVLVKLLGYQANTVKGGKKVLIVTALQVLTEYGEHDTLGNPASIPQANQEDAQPTTITSTGFYGNQQPQQPQQHQSRAMPSHTKPAAASANHNIYPIEALSIYSHKWTIRARCTNKSDIKTWHNRNGEGKLFSVNLLDDSGEIRATGFNDQCSQLYDVFQEGSVYYISAPCRVQMANKKFSNLNNDYELTFERETVVEKAEDQTSVPQVRYNFTTISDLQSVDKDTTVDVVGVLRDVQEVSQITSKTTSKPYDKRELTLCDDTGYEVRLTIWGKTATSFEVSPGSVVAFKGVKVSDFGGRSLSLLSSGSMTVNPDMPDSHRLKGWYDQAGQATTFNTHQNVQGTTVPGERKSDQGKTIAAVKDEQLGMSETPDYFNLRGSIQWIKQDPFCYPACQVEGCNKKVNFMETTGEWRCERHEQQFEKPKYRYIMSVNVGDHTGQMYLSCFDDVGQKIMGMTADELMVIKDEGDEKKFADLFSEANFKMWNWRCRAKMENFQEKQEPRYQVLSATPVEFSAEGHKLAALIKQYDNMNF